MKRNITKFLAALALLVFMMPSLVAWGQNYSRTTTISIGDVVILVCESKTAEMGAVASYGASVAYTTNPAGVNPLTIEAGSAENTYAFKTSDNKYLSWTTGNSLNLSDTKNANSSWSVSFNNNNVLINNAQDNTRKLRYNGSSPRFACYTSDQTAIQLYKATAAAVAAPTFSPANGATFEESLQVTLSQAEGKDIYYNINSESDPDANSTQYTVPFSISATSTIKAISIDGENSSSVATATYTKLVYNNISDIIANQTQYTVKGTVVAKNSRGFVMGDGTGYVYYYKNAAPTQAIGDVVTISGTTSTYGHILQFPSGATVGTATSSNYDGTPSVAIVDATVMAEYNEDYQLSDYVQYEGYLTKNGNYYDIAVGTATARISYPTDAQSSILTELLNKTVRVKGYFAGISTYNSVNYFTTMLESIEEVQNDDPILNVTPTSLTFTYTEGATEVPSKTITITGSNLTQDVTVTLPTGNFTMYNGNDAITSPYTLTPSSEGEIDETITVKMNAGLVQGSYNGTITISWENEEDITIALTGSVTEPEPENYTWNLATNSYSSASTTEVQWTSDFANMTLNKGTSTTNANNYLGGGGNNHTRFYKDQVLTIAPVSGYEITSAVITAVSGNSAGFTGNTWTNATAEASGTTITITPTNGNNPCYVTISAACRATEVKVYYTTSTATNYAISIDADMENGTVVPSVTEATEGTTVTLTVNPAAGYYLENDSDIEVYGTSALTLTKTATGVYTFEMPAEDVTVYAIFSAYTGTYYTLVNSTEELVSGKHYIIASSKINGTAYAMGEQNGDYRNQVETAVVGEMIYATEGVHEIVLTGDATCWTMFDGVTPGYLYAAASNKLKTRTDNSTDNNGNWVISFNEGAASIVSQIEGTDISNTIKYNSGNTRFSCYTPASTMAPVYLYKKANETGVTYLKDIKGYGSNEGGYYLIATPINNLNPANIAGMTNGTYDLYYFDDSQEDEWINYKADENTINEDFGNLISGKGFLYAKKNDVTLAFTGTPYAGNGAIEVAAGWNLIGNPFAVAATPDMPYYRMNADGSGLNATTESGAVNAMEGVFVNATEAGNVTFSTTTPGKGQNIALNVSKATRGASTIDCAIVRFDEGQQLPKFQLFENSTKLYIPQGNQDYAIVRSAAQGEMPVSFKASENGTYTLAVETENMEMDYLHLIDNMTGMDVDLLQTPNYTFEAKTNDYASRFRLVFSASNNGTSTAETFAFFNGTSWTVSNQGEATLQVVDVMGRLVSTEQINGNATINLNETAGIYMLRLVNGNDVKVQKIVVR